MLAEKIKLIENEILQTVQPLCSEKIMMYHYGAYDIDPKYLVFWVCVESDKLKKKLTADKNLLAVLRDLLAKHDYPEKSRKHVHIGFESTETIDRESGGNWYHHFK